MRRMRRWVPVLALVAVMGFVFEVARAHAEAGEGNFDPYRAGPLAQREAPMEFAWPGRGEELLVLGGIAAILYGFRASGLARKRSASIESPMAAHRDAGR